MAGYTLNKKVQSTKGKSNKGGSVAPQAYVGAGIIKQVYPDGPDGQAMVSQMQITVKGLAADSYRGDVTFTADGQKYTLNKGDSHALWYSHQDEDGKTAMEGLFLKLANQSPKPVSLTDIEVVENDAAIDDEENEDDEETEESK